jgi:hypothetical protein
VELGAGRRSRCIRALELLGESVPGLEAVP